MKKIAAICAAACLVASSPAFASSFVSTATGGTLTATGVTSLTALGFVKLTCAATFTGKVLTDGTAEVDTASFTGGPLNACKNVKLTTPFIITPNSTTSVTVNGLQVTAPIPCGPANITASWTNGSPSHFDIPTASVSPGSCTVTATLTVANVTIV